MSKKIFACAMTAIAFCFAEGPVQQTQAEPIAAVSKEKAVNLSISEVVNSGQFLILTDNSVWKIKPSFWSISGSWVMPVTIIVEPSSDDEYPYLLKNNFTNESILAKKSSIEEIHALERKALAPQEKK